MIDFKLLLPENLYHSYVVVGKRDETVLNLADYFKNQKESFEIFVKSYDAFTVEDSLEIKEWHSLRNNNDEKKICILGFHFINHDAERTLLKMLEEPKEGNHFFLVIPNEKLLLDTILSRVQLVKTNKNIDENKYKEVVEFLRSPVSVRLEQIAEIIKKYKDTEGSGGLRNEATVFVNQIEENLYKKWHDNINDENIKLSFSVLARARKYLSIPGSSVKMILEQIALVI